MNQTIVDSVDNFNPNKHRLDNMLLELCNGTFPIEEISISINNTHHTTEDEIDDTSEMLTQIVKDLQRQVKYQEKALKLLTSKSTSALLDMSAELDEHKVDHILKHDEIVMENGTIYFNHRVGYLFVRSGEADGHSSHSIKRIIELYKQ